MELTANFKANLLVGSVARELFSPAKDADSVKISVTSVDIETAEFLEITAQS